jgi:hypothetical protein
MAISKDDIQAALTEISSIDLNDFKKGTEAKLSDKASEDQTNTSHQVDLNAIFNSDEGSSSPISHPIAPGTQVRVLYDGETFTGEVKEYFKTSSGSWALGVNLNVNAGVQYKGFLASKKPVFALL